MHPEWKSTFRPKKKLAASALRSKPWSRCRMQTALRRVSPMSLAGAPASTQALPQDRAIELRENYNQARARYNEQLRALYGV